MDKEILVPTVSAVLTAVLGAAGILIKEWRIRRDVENRRARALADATAVAAFVEQWWKATLGLKDATPELQFHAMNARSFLAHAADTVSASPPFHDGGRDLPGATRRILLLYRFHSKWGLFVRGLFFGCLLLATASYTLGVGDALNGGNGWLDVGYLTVAIAIIYPVPIISLRAAAVHLEKRWAIRHVGFGRVRPQSTMSSTAFHAAARVPQR
ncbi:hypothetical protein ACQP2X_26705 [Actinoplanes sp. CA-131856]